MTGPVQTVVFDLGNVVFEWNPRHLYRKVFATEEEMEHFLSTVCTPQWHVAHDRGVSFEENARTLKERHPLHANLIDMWRSRFQEMIPGLVPGVSGLMAALKARGLAVHGLTNMPSSVFPQLCARFPEIGLLDPTIVSGDEGVVKPDPRIFEILIQRTGLHPTRTLFIDDSRANVEAAAKLGFSTHRFQTAERLRGDLAALGLIG